MRNLVFRLIKRTLKNKHKRFTLGKGHVDRYTLIEIRNLFSIYFHFIDTKYQDRLHTHAFNAVGWTVTGGYDEEVQEDVNGGEKYLKRINKGIRYIPKMYNHRILQSEPNTMTILFTGPYNELWTEETDTYVKLITKGNKEIGRFEK
jgi:hypothetical protein